MFLIGSKFFSTSPLLNKYFNKILIANRGEIACRIIKTAKKCGIKTVAVYSDADINSKYVHLADESIRIGPSQVNQSYLVQDLIIDAMKKTGVEAVHPGYGFLSENATFSDRVKKEGFIFIGPPGDAIRALGSKIESKIIAAEAGVNTIPGFKGECRDTNHALEIAMEIGYPVMCKAADGGGGKGIRICFNEKELKESYQLSANEALNFFGSNRMLIEKFVANPRHVEIQVLCDQCGNYLFLPERECSVQRRNQKVIEESPCSVMDMETRRMMGEQATSLCKRVGYYSAGTVEMLLSVTEGKKNFYFLEMNTRLQVEHPITEMITGIDLVEEMFRVAKGLPITFTQEEILKRMKGNATECRVYAEDPSKNYAPSIGTLDIYIEPFPGDQNVRVDSGILRCSEISMYYDPMIAKLITYGKTREESINKMVDALDEYVIRGVKHNVTLLRTVLNNKKYRSGQYTTQILKEEYGTDFKQLPLTDNQKSNLIVVASCMELLSKIKEDSINQQLKEKKSLKKIKFSVILEEKEYLTEVEIIDKNKYNVKLNNKDFKIESDWKSGEIIFYSKINGKKEVLQLLDKKVNVLLMQYLGNQFNIRVQSPEQSKYLPLMPIPKPPDTSKFLVAPMPGTIVSVAVKEGDIVMENSELCIVEAMKMQNMLRSTADVKIKKVNIKTGQTVENDEILMEFEKK